MPQRVVAENGAFIGGRPGPQKGLCRRIGGETSRYGQFWVEIFFKEFLQRVADLKRQAVKIVLSNFQQLYELLF